MQWLRKGRVKMRTRLHSTATGFSECAATPGTMKHTRVSQLCVAPTLLTSMSTCRSGGEQAEVEGYLMDQVRMLTVLVVMC